jgi:hypothetical protein
MTEAAGGDTAAAPSVKAMFGRTPRAEVEQALGRAIAELPPEDALITRMHFRDGMTAGDVAWILRLDAVDTTQRMGGILTRFRGILSRYDASAQDVLALLAGPAVWDSVPAVPRQMFDTRAPSAGTDGDRASVVHAWLGDESSYTERPLLLNVLLSDRREYDAFLHSAREKIARRPVVVPDSAAAAPRSSRTRYVAVVVLLIVLGGMLLRYYFGR